MVVSKSTMDRIKLSPKNNNYNLSLYNLPFNSMFKHDSNSSKPRLKDILLITMLRYTYL